MNRSIIEVTFKVYAELGFGEEVYVSGNVPSLGCDDINRAIPLVTSADDFPWWQSKEGIFLPADSDIKYRYCIFSGGKFKRWEGDSNFIRVIDTTKVKTFNRILEDKLGEKTFNFRYTADKTSKKVALTALESNSERAKMFSAWGRSSFGDKLGAQDGVIMVSYFLPVILSRKPSGGWSAIWDKEALLSIQIDVRLMWVGCVRYNGGPIPVEEEESVSSALSEINCYPIFINQTMHHLFYDIYCKQNLWLIMHHIADVYGPLNLSEKSFKAQQNLWFNYSTVLKMFREKVLEVFQQGYLIWIHGFHLMLLPSFLRRRLPTAKIGYFFHTPFPSSEIWRTMPRREDLLRGILGADQIGFHLYEYARHFLTTCHRLLGYSSETNSSGKMTVNVDGRAVSISCIHVGVDLPRLKDIFEIDNFKEEILMWKERFGNRIVVSGLDRLEKLKGWPLRMMAIDQFLGENPNMIGKIVFAMIGITAMERGDDYRQTQHDVRAFVRKINEKYTSGTEPIMYFEERKERDIRLSQRLAYFAASDIFLMTAARDGLNRYPMEFTLARHAHGALIENGSIPLVPRLQGAGLPSQGLVIISEFISSARVMRGAMVVNPWRVEDVKDVLKLALTMDDSERADRSRRNLEFSTRLTTSNWAKHVLDDLNSIERNSDPNSSYGVGFGLQYKIMNLKAGFCPLDIKEAFKAYRSSRHRLILLDWGGTLVPNVDKQDKLHAYAIATGHASREGPSAELKGVLEILCSDNKNIVFVVSGKEIRAVTDYFGSIKGLGLAAEHGFYYKWPKEEYPWDVSSKENSKSTAAGWQTMMDIPDDSWKESARIIMDIFVQRTHGTYIEQKGNALIWQYSDADPEFGFLQSKELEEHLSSVLASYPIEVIRGGGVADGYIEVRPSVASKGAFIEHAISFMKANNNDPDFILAMGDDNSDEPMFERINNLYQDASSFVNTFSVTVGKKPSAAKAYVDDPAGVFEVLSTLSRALNKEKRYFSVTDLPSYAQNDVSSFATFAKKDQYDFQQNISQVKSAPFGLHRATSDGNFSMGPLDKFQQFKQGTHVIQPTESVDDHPFSLKSMPSAAHLSMTEYMNSISEDHREDDGGIFF